MTDVKAIPDNYPRVTPYLVVDGAAAAIDFYTKVLGLSERGGRMTGPDGRVGHTELMLGESVVMLADSFPEMGIRGPKDVGGTPITLHVYVEDVDAMVDHAVKEGAKIARPVEDKFYGDRSATIEDPWGHLWNLASHVEDVPPDEMQKRAAAEMAQG